MTIPHSSSLIDTMLSNMYAYENSSSIIGVISAIIAIYVAICLDVIGKPLRRTSSRLISLVIGRFLVWRHEIKSEIDGATIPSVPYVWPNGQGDVAKFLEGEKNSQQWGAKYGSLYRVWSGTTPEIVLTSPGDIQRLFFDSDKHTKAVNNNSGWLMGELLGRCLGLISGGPYQKLKAATSAHFLQKAATSYLPQIECITNDYIQKLDAELPKRAYLLDPVEDLKYLPFWVLVHILYGDLNPQTKSKLQSLARSREHLWTRMIQGGASRFSFGRYLSLQFTKDLKTFKEDWRRLNRSAYEACLVGNETAAIVGMYNRVSDGAIDEESVLQTLDEMLFANLDVTMGGLSWNLLFLARYQDTQNQIRGDIRSSASRDEYIQSSSTILAYAILESSRLKPLAAFTVPQSAPTSRVVQGFRIPANTNCIIDTHALNIRNPFWGLDTEQYRPSRFAEINRHAMRYQFWRFGFGPRQCLGKYVVDLILRSAISNLVEKHRLALIETSQWNKNPTTWILHPKTQILCEPFKEEARNALQDHMKI